MNSTLCRTLRKMLADGFEQYDGVIEQDVYKRLGCSNPARAYWVCNWPILHCLGCNERCTPKNIEGFQIVLPKPDDSTVAKQAKIASMLEKDFLRPDEAALCLGVSERLVRNYVDEGILIRHKRPPLRITLKSVKAEMKQLYI